MEPAKNILVISHGFPPNAGIAGRRWAKFSKYLQREGYHVFVLAATPISKEKSNWIRDTENIPVEYLPFMYPKWVYAPDKSLSSKILHKICLPLLKLYDRGNYYDRSIFWKSQIQKKIAEYIYSKKIDTVIVSSGPFRLSYYVAQMKRSFPEVKFIVDFRDLWTEDVEITSFSNLPLKRKKLEKVWEKETVQLADTVITVADSMTSYFDSLTIKKKTFTIPNGFDEDDFRNLDIKVNHHSNNKIKFLFTGTLYKNLSYILIPFFQSLEKLKTENPAVFSKIEISFIGIFPSEYRQIIADYHMETSVKVYEKVPLDTVYSKINETDFCLLFLNNVYNFSLSTKFCEYISQKKKIVVVANKGPAVDFILQNELGYWIDPENAFNSLVNILEAYDTKKHLQWNSDFNVDSFSVKVLTKKLIHHLNDRNFTKSKGQLSVKNVLMTFDYELFLGKVSGTIHNCLIKPTNLVLEILKRHGIKQSIFFVDTVYLDRLQQETNELCKIDFQIILNQLTSILQQGHYIFPHIHSHWLDAEYNEKENVWHLNKLNKYRFHHLSTEERSSLFTKSIDLVKQIQQLAGINYPIDCYRAGGWCLQPFSDFKPYFEQFGIRYDFSVLRNATNQSALTYYDFTHIPQKQIYPFSKDVDSWDPNGTFIEFSISNIQIEQRTVFFSKFLLRYLKLTKDINFGDGLSVRLKNYIFTEQRKKESPLINMMDSVELLTSMNKKYFLKHLKENDYLHFISHPKMLSKHNLKHFDEIISNMTKNYILVTDYKTIISNANM